MPTSGTLQFNGRGALLRRGVEVGKTLPLLSVSGASGNGPLLAQSGHGLVHRTCLLFDPKRTGLTQASARAGAKRMLANYERAGDVGHLPSRLPLACEFLCLGYLCWGHELLDTVSTCFRLF
jgi:hypothetical protein